MLNVQIIVKKQDKVIGACDAEMNHIAKFIVKYKNTRIQIRASFWYTVCSFLQKGISFIVVPIYTRLLTSEEYGNYSVFQSWVGIVSIFATLNLGAGVYTKAMVDYTDERDRYTSAMQGLGTVSVIVIFAIYMFFSDWVNSFLDINLMIAMMTIVNFLLSPSYGFWSTRQRVDYKYQAMVVMTLITSCLTPMVSIVLLIFSNLRADALIIGGLVVSAIEGLFFYIYYFHKGLCFFDRHYWKYALSFNLPLIPHYLSLVVLGQSDRIMVKYFCGSSDAGIYTLASQIGLILSTLVGAINGSRVPWTYEKMKNREYKKIRKISMPLVFVMEAMVIMIMLFLPELVWILGGEEYAQAMYIAPIITVSVLMTFLYDLFATVEFYYGYTKYVMVASTTGAILNLVLNYIFIPLYGYTAAAYTTVFCYFIFMIMHYVFMNFVKRKEGIADNIFDVKIIFLSLAVVFVMSVVCTLMFERTLVRIILFCMLSGIGFFMKKRIKSNLDMMKEK